MSEPAFGSIITAVCDEIREGFAFTSPSHSANWTFTFTDGPTSRTYGLWISANYPELAGDLINEFTGDWKLSPGTIATHRELVAEWQAQR